MRIEPEWYCPILPMVLVNGSDGIGTGYSTSVPNYDPREIVANLKRMMNGMEPTEMVCTIYVLDECGCDVIEFDIMGAVGENDMNCISVSGN